jgi:Cu-processing system permease protein
MNIEPGQIAILANKEFHDRLRSRWVLAVAAIFAVFALAIAYLGTAQEGALGFRGMDLTIASLVSLVIYLVPLIALILGYDAFVGEREQGSLDLLLSMPVTRLELLLGKFSGLSAAMTVATLAGFGLAGLALSYGVGQPALLQYAVFMLTTVLLGEAFLSIAVLVSVLARTKVAASAIAIVLWFLFVLVFDLGLLGLLVATEGRYGGDILPLLLLLNPADIFRIINVYGMEEVRMLYGLATVFPRALANPWALASAMLAWIVAPLGLAYARLLSRHSG